MTYDKHGMVKPTFGRPTTYSKQKYLKAMDYINGGFIEQGFTVPTVEGLAVLLRTAKKVLYDWAKNHDDFSDAMHELKDKQGAILIEKGLTGQYNSTITKLMLHQHGYSDRVEQYNINETVESVAPATFKGVVKSTDNTRPDKPQKELPREKTTAHIRTGGNGSRRRLNYASIEQQSARRERIKKARQAPSDE